MSEDKLSNIESCLKRMEQKQVDHTVLLARVDERTLQLEKRLENTEKSARNRGAAAGTAAASATSAVAAFLYAMFGVGK